MADVPLKPEQVVVAEEQLHSATAAPLHSEEDWPQEGLEDEENGQVRDAGGDEAEDEEEEEMEEIEVEQPEPQHDQSDQQQVKVSLAPASEGSEPVRVNLAAASSNGNNSHMPENTSAKDAQDGQDVVGRLSALLKESEQRPQDSTVLLSISAPRVSTSLLTQSLARADEQKVERAASNASEDTQDTSEPVPIRPPRISSSLLTQSLANSDESQDTRDPVSVRAPRISSSLLTQAFASSETQDREPVATSAPRVSSSLLTQALASSDQKDTAERFSTSAPRVSAELLAQRFENDDEQEAEDSTERTSTSAPRVSAELLHELQADKGDEDVAERLSALLQGADRTQDSAERLSTSAPRVSVPVRIAAAQPDTSTAADRSDVVGSAPTRITGFDPLRPRVQPARAAGLPSLGAPSLRPSSPASRSAAASQVSSSSGLRVAASAQHTVEDDVASALSAAVGRRLMPRPIPCRGSRAGTTKGNVGSSKHLTSASSSSSGSGIRVKLLRISKRLEKLGNPQRSSVVTQVLYRLELAESLRAQAGRPMGVPAHGLERPMQLAEQLASQWALQEASQGEDSDIDFECTILALGKSGSGKTATIASLLGLDLPSSPANPFESATTKVCIVLPGCLIFQTAVSNWLDVQAKEYVGRVCGVKVRIIDTPGLSSGFGQSSVTENPKKTTAAIKRFVKNKSPDIVLYFDRFDVPARDFGDLPILRAVTETFGAAIWFNSIIVLTHGASAPPENNAGTQMSYEMYVAQRSHVIQNMIRESCRDARIMTPVALVENHPACRTNRQGQRILPNGVAWKPQLLLLCFASKILTEANSLLQLQENAAGRPFQRAKIPPMPILLSSLITSRQPRKPPQEEEYYPGEDELPPEEEPEKSKQVAVPAPDPALPPTFDADNPSHRYRHLESPNQWMFRPVVESHSFDHESGIDGFSMEKNFLYKKKIPANISGQITKDKKDASYNLETEVSYPHSDTKVTTAGVDVQTIGKDQVYTLRAETRLKNRTSLGVSGSRVAGTIAKGIKIENRLKVHKGLKLVVSAGAVKAKKDMAYGGNVECVLSRADPMDPTRTTISGSLMNWKGRDQALAGNIASQFNATPNTLLTVRGNVNSRGAGQVSMRLSSNENMKLALAGVVPLALTAYNALFRRG
eukprot:jgi/Chlat1/1681/Chrsp127S01920